MAEKIPEQHESAQFLSVEEEMADLQSRMVRLHHEVAQMVREFVVVNKVPYQNDETTEAGKTERAAKKALLQGRAEPLKKATQQLKQMIKKFRAALKSAELDHSKKFNNVFLDQHILNAMEVTIAKARVCYD